MTASYRRDSDITRIWGSGQNTIDLLRWDKKNEKFISYEDHINDIMSRKSTERLSSKEIYTTKMFHLFTLKFGSFQIVIIQMVPVNVGSMVNH